MTEDGSPPKPTASVPPPPPTPSRPPASVPPPTPSSSPPAGGSVPPPPPFRPATQPFSPEMIVHDSGVDTVVGNKTIQGQPVPPAVTASQPPPSTSQPPLGGPAMSVESQPVQLPQTPAAAALTEAIGSFDGDAFKSLARAFVDFNLDKVVTRTLAKVLYALSWIEAVAVLLMGWYNAVIAIINGAVGVGLAMLMLAPLGAIGVLILARIICELLILAVSSHEALQEIRESLKKA